MAKNHALSMVCILVMLLMLLNPLLSLAAVTRSLSYSPFSSYQGVIESDRFDYMSADGNPLKEDTANAIFQGPGVFQHIKTSLTRGSITICNDTVGFMKDVYLTLTKYGTLTKMNYTGEETTPYHWLPVIELTPVGRAVDFAPLEGWAIAYNMTVYPTQVFPYDEGYLVVTFSGFRATDGRIIANVMGQDSDDDWALSVAKDVWVDNPRLLALFYNVSATNFGSPYEPKFELDIVIVFNKATKFVEIFQKLKLISISLPPECMSVQLNMALARMAIFDANPWCDRAFYGWKNVTISDLEFFMVLSWTNETLEKWVRTDLGYDYYGAYMASYPVPDSWAIASTWYDSNAYGVWHAPQLRYSTLDKYAFLYMYDIDNDGTGDGDQALTRVEWYNNTGLVLPERLPGTEIGWKMVMYGVYDVNGTSYDGGEGGWFKNGYLRLSNGDAFNDGSTVPSALPPGTPSKPPYPWPHTGTLGWLNGDVSDVELTDREAMLTKLVTYLDIDQDGNKGIDETNDGDSVKATDEVNIPFKWWPTEELYWQLTYKFAPPVFKKYDTTCCFFEYWDDIRGSQNPDHEMWDFTVLPAPGATTDAAGAAWLTARFTSLLVLFDVEAYNMTATVGYTNPDLKMLPYLMLRLGEASKTVEGYAARRSRYLTSDKRALPQMEFEDRETTLWRDVHYLLVTVAGVRPNLATYYFNDFTQIPFALGGDRANSYVVLPYGGPVDITPYSGSKKTMGLAVIALARDHFNNIALVVTATDSQDTYWSAWIATWYWAGIQADLGDWSAIMYKIDYTAITNNWGDGKGIPIAHPNYPLVNGEPAFILVANATEYACEPGL